MQGKKKFSVVGFQFLVEKYKDGKDARCKIRKYCTVRIALKIQSNKRNK